ncbi:gamma-glutamyl-gamma-aminobutyrate hydrolase family protein [Piscicoccus intestinalis]|uniref:gamma-glutamyl-gamma-aminobutyrate hydrolase family protein n=1 Tax=Piscicoccus intestinalis TaxID=746033 RepID=UPI001FDF776A|nr:gamma-glutamyl-gamma-aminobutyrate hydrolase family protein [Piscicoccus intestinalis]
MAHDVHPRRLSPPDCSPLIGLTTYVEAIDRGEWVAQRTALLPHDYVRAVEACGALPVLVPPRADLTPRLAEELVGRLDGLIITGGADVAPGRYGRRPHPATQPPRPDRDHSELLLTRAARAAQLPLLGICRGMQIMAVEAGGVLEQHVPDRVGHGAHAPGSGTFGRHQIRVVADTRLAAVLGGGHSPHGDVVEGHCAHHQSVLAHPGYRPAAFAADGTLEAMEADTSGPPGAGGEPAQFALAVQWHPENGADARLFAALVAAARDRMRASGA